MKATLTAFVEVQEHAKANDLHISETSAYWRNLAANERSMARLSYKTVDSIRIHRAQAEQYERQADRLQARGQ